MADGEDNRIWTYNPSFALAIVVALFYLVPTFVLFWQTLIKYRSWFFLCALIGSAIEVAGYGMRAWSCKEQASIPAYATSATLIIIAPIFIAAANYLLISRLILSVLPSTNHRIFFIPARLLTRTFVIFDILTCLTQASGSSIAGAGDWKGKEAEVGTNVLIGGLSLQVATFCWFLSIVGRFWKITRSGVRGDAPKDWEKVLHTILLSSSLILIRSVYRVIEFALGIDGYPFRHEWIFYVFEALPMLPAIAVFCFVHPAKYLGSKGKDERFEDGGIELLQNLRVR